MPTNVVLYAAGDHLGEEGLSLETAAGARVPITVSRALPTGFDVTPVIELEPNQRYVLRHPGFSLLAVGASNTSVEFETGSGAAEGAMLPPPELDAATVLDGVDSPCPNQRLCLEPGGPESVLFAAHSSDNLSERAPGTLTGAYGNASIPEGCLQVWRRDALGNRSEVVELCAADVTRVEFLGDAAWTTCEEYHQDLLALGGADDPGCTFAVIDTRTSSRGALGAVLGLLAVFGVSRRRRGSRSATLHRAPDAADGSADGDVIITD